MRIKHLSFEMFRQNHEKFDDIVLELKDGREFIIHNNTDYEFNDRKRRIDCWRYGRFSYVNYNEIVNIRGELL